VTRAAVAGILLAAAIVRIFAIDFCLPSHYCRPDEEAVGSVVMRVLARDLNPHWFDWPSLFMYLTALSLVLIFKIGNVLGWYRGEYHFLQLLTADPAPVYLAARLLSAAAGVLTVWLLYRTARRWFGHLEALVAAAFLALAFLHVRDSHFGVTDVTATCLGMASFACTVRFHAHPGTREALPAALLGGLAASTKYNAALLLVPAFVSQVLEVVDARREGRPPLADLRSCRFLGAFALAFALGTPYALLDPAGFGGGLARVAAHLRSGHGVDLGAGWLYHLAVSLRYAVGWPVLLAGLIGMAWLAWRRPREALLLFAFPLALYAAAGSGRTVFVRYIIPVIPFVCISAAVAVDAAVRRVAEVAGLSARAAGATTAAVAALAVIPSAANLAWFDAVVGRLDNRVIAARWLDQHVPRGASLHQTGDFYASVDLDRTAYDVWDFDEERGLFTGSGQVRSAGPDWILVQRSPLTFYSSVPAALERLIASDGYALVRSFQAIDLTAPGNVFDQQDAFFLPLAGFNGIRRPGPNFEVYRRTGAALDTPRP
jgi:hypothetical protein